MYRSDLIYLRYCWTKNCLFVCLFVFLFLLFESSQDTPGKIFWKFHKDWTWFSWDIIDLKIVYLFVCFFVSFFVFFHLRHLRIHTPRMSFWNFCKDQSWFSWDIVNLINCLFVCLFVFLFESSQDTLWKISWRFQQD